MKRPGLLGIVLAAIVVTANCGGGGDTKTEAASSTTAATAAESTTTTAAATTTTAAAAAAAASGQALKDGFSVVSGTSLYTIEDTKENTVGNTVYTGWKATLDLTGDLDAIAEAFKAQITANGYMLYPEDKGSNEQDGKKFFYRSLVGVKEEPSAKAVGGKRTTDRVGIDCLKSDSGAGQVKIYVEHMRYTD